MADFSDYYGGKYLKAEDVQSKPFVGVIERVKGEKMNDGRMKAVVYFENREKGCVLNATRHKFMVAVAKSKNSDDWLGVKVAVRAGTTDFGGKEVGCVEFSAPPKSAKQKAAEVKAELNDELPDFAAAGDEDF